MEQDRQDIRWKQRFQNFERAVLRLREGSVLLQANADNLLMQAGIIQMFEFTFELAWKLLKDYLQDEGFVLASPKATIRQAFQSGYIDDADDWMLALQDRNLTVHTYDDATVTAVVHDICTKYIPMLDKLYTDFKQRL